MSTVIRNATRAEIATLLDWAAAEGWNPGLDDASAFWAADPEGFHVIEEDGAIVASLSVVRFSDSFAFLGFYIVRPDERGKGRGLAFWNAIVERDEDLTIGLDGVIAQQDIYRRSGFMTAHGNVRYGGAPRLAAPSSEELIEVAPLHLPMIVDFDRRFNAARREDFLREWLKQGDDRQSFALMRDGAILGYATVRACRQGFKIGPLFCETEAGADLLFRRAAAVAGVEEVFLDIPAPNAAARALCERYNLKPVLETVRMYRGLAPDLPLGRIYGITSFELG
ncbi:GNAT family N-acetyltransferase [Ensifer soli]|uniref:GNAT family N-acetyltransferase n=1 Tax=Ciceribacter sp. sgz301302 TaxID=3342379 RepID=UPI0035BB0658